MTKVNRLEKEKQDYIFCLEAASKFEPREGVLLVEDDSLPGIRFYYISQSIRFYYISQSIRFYYISQSIRLFYINQSICFHIAEASLQETIWWTA